MEEKTGYLFTIIISALLGIAAGYMLTGIIDLKLPPYLPNENPVPVSTKTVQKMEKINSVIIANNVLAIDTGMARRHKAEQNVKVAKEIDGYRLVGFVSGENPMALFKKKNKPVVIVTKKKGLNSVWFLDKLTPRGVYLKNRKTGEIKKFIFPGREKQLSMFGSTPSKTTGRPHSLSGNIIKTRISRKLVERLNINNLLKQINIAPAFRHGKAMGYRILYLSPSSVLSRVGLRRGDIIVSVNGVPATEPEKIMEIYSQLKEMTSVNIDILRGGVKKTLFIEIK